MAERKEHGVLEASYKAKAQYHELKEVRNPENIEDYEPSALKIRIMSGEMDEEHLFVHVKTEV
jgi:hypothetical protein